MTDLNPEKLDALERTARHATPGAWAAFEDEGLIVWDGYSRGTADVMRKLAWQRVPFQVKPVPHNKTQNDRS